MESRFHLGLGPEGKYANWYGDTEDMKSTAGYMFFYGGAPISWSSKKESIFALTSCEAEYIAAELCMSSSLADEFD